MEAGGERHGSARESLAGRARESSRLVCGKLPPASGVGRAQHAEVAPAGDLQRIRGTRTATAPGPVAAVLRTRRFPYGVGERFEVVTAGAGGRGGVGEPDDLPAAWRGQPLAVLGTEVVAVGLGVGGERAEDRSRVGIDVRQCRDGRAAARGARTATYRAHDVGRYRTLDRAAKTLPQLTPPCRPVASGSAASGATPLTCGATRGYASRRQPFRSPRASNTVMWQEAHGRERGLKRAPPWPDRSRTDSPVRPSGSPRESPWETARGSAGQSPVDRRPLAPWSVTLRR